MSMGEAGIAAPIRGHGGLVVGAIGVSGPVERICDSKGRPQPTLVGLTPGRRPRHLPRPRRGPLVTHAAAQPHRRRTGRQAEAMAERYVMAIDQGTTSTRCIVFDHRGRLVSVAQREHQQYFPQAGLGRARRRGDLAQRRAASCPRRCAEAGVDRRRRSPRSASPTSARPRWCGTGAPASRSASAIVWQDTRTDALVAGARRATPAPTGSATCAACRSPPTSPAPKLRWLLDHVAGLRERAERGEVLFGTMETWLIWNLTGGPNGGMHVTDVTNASRTMLMDIHTLQLGRRAAGVLRRPAGDAAGDPLLRRGLRHRRGTVLPGVRIGAALGDQQAALFGQTCFAPGEAKCTYGTGSFLLLNTGTELGPLHARAAHHRRLQDRRRRRRLRAGGLDRGHRLAGAVVPRQPRADQQRPGDRDARPHRRGQRRLLHRARRSPGCSRRTGAARRAA